jgi:peroxiredoxin Q/BCP
MIRFNIGVFGLMMLFALTFFLNDVRAVKVGDTAPVFSANTDNGDLWNLKDYFGKSFVVVYFYPAAMTGGCTKQACSFRDDRSALSEEDIEVVGVSGDPVKNLKLFKQAHNLNFTLLSDISGEIANKFGVPLSEGGSITRTIDGEEILMLRGVTTDRWTFIVDKTGKVIYKNAEVDAANDSKEVLSFIKNMQQ